MDRAKKIIPCQLTQTRRADAVPGYRPPGSSDDVSSIAATLPMPNLAVHPPGTPL